MDKKLQEFQMTKTGSNQEIAFSKNIFKKLKPIHILYITLLAIALFVVIIVAVVIPRSKATAYQEKLDTWVSLMNFEGISEENRKTYGFESKIKDLHMELGFFLDSDVKNIPMDALREYILSNDVDRLLTASINAQDYACNDALWVMYETIYELYPERFQKVVLDKNSTSGYYIDNPTAYPGVTREVKGDHDEFTDYCEVTHYGDFAVLEEKKWRYDEGVCRWANGVFYDEYAHWEQRTFVSVYYKGNRFWRVIDSLSEVQDVIFCETDTHIYKLYYDDDGHLTGDNYFKKDK